MSKTQNKTPGKALKNIINTSSTPNATGKKHNYRHDRLDTGATVDVGALLRGSLLVPKLRGQQDQQPAAPAPSKSRENPSPSTFLQPNPVYSPGLASPDESLAAAASKIALLKASRMGSQANIRAATKTADSKHVAVQQTASPARESQCATKPARDTTHSDSLTNAAFPAQYASQDPEYQPQENIPCSDSQESELPLAARTAIGKRQRRKSQHHGPQRFGEWFAGDDDQLEATLAEYNFTQQLEPRMTRAQRRKSALPILDASMIPGNNAHTELQQEPSEEEKAAESRKVRMKSHLVGRGDGFDSSSSVCYQGLMRLEHNSILLRCCLHDTECNRLHCTSILMLCCRK